MLIDVKFNDEKIEKTYAEVQKCFRELENAVFQFKLAVTGSSFCRTDESSAKEEATKIE